MNNGNRDLATERIPGGALETLPKEGRQEWHSEYGTAQALVYFKE
jgi:hypothetical protein